MTADGAGDGRHDLQAAVDLLGERLPPELRPLADLAYNYWWSWQPAGQAVFAQLDARRWEQCGHNPVRFLLELPSATLAASAGDGALVERVHRLAAEQQAVLAGPRPPGPISAEHPVAFLCAEFGVHSSLPIYSGGLGVLAGDLLKQASDDGFPMVGVGLLYRTGYFHQRLDVSGYQHEYWTELEPGRSPCVPVTGPGGAPLHITIPIANEDVSAVVWRVAVGRVPLYLLDTDVEGNTQVGRWVTSRLYEGNPELRLAQYAVLGLGGARALEALGIRPSVYHLNEGHPALATVELAAELVASGIPPDQAWDQVRRSVVFTTHTPVAAGNETYPAVEFLSALGRLADLAGDRHRLSAMSRFDPTDEGAPCGLSTLALRVSRSTNAVSRRHGEVARATWQPTGSGGDVREVPITHVTNGVHVATWLGEALRSLLDARLGAGWLDRASDPRTWDAVDDIADEELWAARSEARRRLIEHVRILATNDRLRRGEGIGYAEAAQHGLDPDALTIGFARRIASYKRIHLLGVDPDRALALLDGDRPVQVLLAGKAHPRDEEAKRIVQDLFQLKAAPVVGGRVVFLEDYDLELAREMVAGCDLWVNLPRPPLEASGTSGMKAAFNGVLNLSVLDGWWAEVFDGTNGWAIDGEVDGDHGAQDQRHAQRLYDLLEQEVVPLFHDRDSTGVPHGWVAAMKRSLTTIGPKVCAQRMLADYAERVYDA